MGRFRRRKRLKFRKVRLTGGPFDGERRTVCMDEDIDTHVEFISPGCTQVWCFGDAVYDAKGQYLRTEHCAHTKEKSHVMA